MKTLSALILILFAGVSSGAVDGEGLAKELTAIRDEIGKATGIKFSRIKYKQELESVASEFNRDCYRWKISNDKEYHYFSVPIMLNDDDQIDTQLVKDTLGGKHHRDPDVQRLNKPPIQLAGIMWYLYPDVEKIGCRREISCASTLKYKNERELAKILGRSKEWKMDGGCLLGMYRPNPNKDMDDILTQIAKYYFDNGLEERLQTLLLEKTGGQANRQADDISSIGKATGK